MKEAKIIKENIDKFNYFKSLYKKLYEKDHNANKKAILAKIFATNISESGL